MLRTERDAMLRRSNQYKVVTMSRKLMSGVEPLKHYWVHSGILNEAIKDGWRVTKVYTLLCFEAQAVCADYIQFNQDKRLFYSSQGKSAQADMFKLNNNAFYGWTIRAPETYKETTLLFSGQTSYNYFETMAKESHNNVTSGNRKSENISIKGWEGDHRRLENAIGLLTSNPHDSFEDKVLKMSDMFDAEINDVIKAVNECRNSLDVTLRRMKSMVNRHLSPGKDLSEEKVNEKKQKLSRLIRLKDLKKTRLDDYVKYKNEIIQLKLLALTKFRQEHEDKIVRENMLKDENIRKKGKSYAVPACKLPINKAEAESKTRDESIKAWMRSRTNVDCNIVMFDDNSAYSRMKKNNVCFGYGIATKSSMTLKTTMGMGMSVLSNAKARITQFARCVHQTLANRLPGLKLELTMTDTDSVTYYLSYLVLMLKDRRTKRLVFPSSQQEDFVLNRCLGVDSFKGQVELLLCASPEMRRMVDRAFFMPEKSYYDPSRKKKVGFYADEVPLDSLILSFQACGPKNYQFHKEHLNEEKTGRVVTNVNKHKGVSKQTQVTAGEYTDVITMWDRLYDKNNVIKSYDVQKRTSSEVFKDLSDSALIKSYKESQRNGKQQKRKRIISKDVKALKAEKLQNRASVEEVYEEQCFSTTKDGIYKVNRKKRLCVRLSDKVVFPRRCFSAWSIGTDFVKNVVRKHNESKTYHEMFTDKSLDELNAKEEEYFETAPRYFSNGVVATETLKLMEELDNWACFIHMDKRIKQLTAKRNSKHEKEPLIEIMIQNEPDREVDGEEDLN